MESYKNQSDRLDFAFQESRKKIDINGTMTAKEAYKALELSQSTFSAYRKGSEPSAAVLRKLTQFTGINIHWLVTGEGDIYTEKSTLKHITGNETLDIDKTLLPKLNDKIVFDRATNDDSKVMLRRGDIVVIDTKSENQEGVFVVEIAAHRAIVKLQLNSDGASTISNEKISQQLDNTVNILGEVIWSCGNVNG
ncbi:helix-turn-helix domain containing protein [Pseudoalteromonas sp. Of11M-6]|uniref:helix-turn-helix domain containing protein n=1 Tax=Pseudoalteromonas sp. Of11M-6 TaxID=2917754 RepID=UPI001EF3FD86|nr:helix-turn-helix domain containing protein [Pseudoalteromonas sp. Of11M-6]MCG7553082.1 helix-turn-helix domain containing protein [Pseudoalteromonas sp. Of11M-6]